MSDFTEVAARVWVARYEWYDVNVTVIEGEAGLLVVDTHASTKAAQEVIADLRRLSSRPVVGLVNTHEHVDHVFGNAAFREEYGEVPITAHEVAAANTVPHGEQVKASSVARGDHRADEIAETPIVPANHTFSSVATIDLGDRAVELVHPGRGHTGGDLVVRIDDADVVLAGDLVEESGAPSYGERLLPAGLAPFSRPRPRARSARRPWWCRVTGCRSTATSCRSSAPRSTWSLARSTTWPAAECR